MNLLHSQLNFDNEAIAGFFVSIIDAVKYFKLNVCPANDTWTINILKALNPKFRQIDFKLKFSEDPISKQYIYKLYKSLPEQLQTQLFASSGYCNICQLMQSLPLFSSSMHPYLCKDCGAQIQLQQVPKLQIIKCQQLKTEFDSVYRELSTVILYKDNQLTLIKYFPETDQFYCCKNGGFLELNKTKLLQFLTNPLKDSAVKRKFGNPLYYIFLTEKKHECASDSLGNENIKYVCRSARVTSNELKMQSVIDTKDENYDENIIIQKNHIDIQDQPLQLKQLFYEKQLQTDEKFQQKRDKHLIDEQYSIKMWKFNINLWHLIIFVVFAVLAIYNFISLALINAKLGGRGIVLDNLIVRDKLFVHYENITKLDQIDSKLASQLYATTISASQLRAENFTVESQYLPGMYELEALTTQELRCNQLVVENVSISRYANVSELTSEVSRTFFQQSVTVKADNVTVTQIQTGSIEIRDIILNLDADSITAKTFKAENLTAAKADFQKITATEITGTTIKVNKFNVDSAAFVTIATDELLVHENLTITGKEVLFSDDARIVANNATLSVGDFKVGSLVAGDVNATTLSSTMGSFEALSVAQNATVSGTLEVDQLDVKTSVLLNSKPFIQAVNDRLVAIGVSVTINGQCVVQGNLNVQGTINGTITPP